MGKEYRKQVEIVSTIKVPTLALLEDNLEATLLKWSKTGTTGSTLTRDATEAYNGEASLKCLTRAGGAVDGDNVYGMRIVKLTNRRYINFKFTVLNQIIGVNGSILYIFFDFWDTIGAGKAGFKLDDNTHKLYYYDANDNWIELSDYRLVNMGSAWYNIEIQIDRIERTYEYILIGESNPNIKNLKFKNNPAATENSFLYIKLGVIQNHQADATSAITHYDDIVITTPDQ